MLSSLLPIIPVVEDRLRRIVLELVFLVFGLGVFMVNGGSGAGNRGGSGMKSASFACTPVDQPPWSWWGCLVPFISRPLWEMWQGSEEPARGHRCGWPQGSLRVLGPCTKRLVNNYILEGTTRASRTPCRHLALRALLGAAMKAPAPAGATAPSHSAHLSPCLYGVGGLHKTTTLIIVLLVVFAATAAVVYPEVVDGEESKTEFTIVPCTHPLEIEACEGMCSLDSECTQLSSIPKSELPVLIDPTTKFA